MTRDELGSFILALRQSSNMSRNDLAKQLRVSKLYISRIEQGKIFPCMRLIEDFSQIFGVSLLEIMILDRINDKKIDKKDADTALTNIIYIIEYIRKREAVNLIRGALLFIVLILVILFIPIK